MFLGHHRLVLKVRPNWERHPHGPYGPKSGAPSLVSKAPLVPYGLGEAPSLVMLTWDEEATPPIAHPLDFCNL